MVLHADPRHNSAATSERSRASAADSHPGNRQSGYPSVDRSATTTAWERPTSHRIDLSRLCRLRKLRFRFGSFVEKALYLGSNLVSNASKHILFLFCGMLRAFRIVNTPVHQIRCEWKYRCPFAGRVAHCNDVGEMFL